MGQGRAPAPVLSRPLTWTPTTVPGTDLGPQPRGGPLVAGCGSAVALGYQEGKSGLLGHFSCSGSGGGRRTVAPGQWHRGNRRGWGQRPLHCGGMGTLRRDCAPRVPGGSVKGGLRPISVASCLPRPLSPLPEPGPREQGRVKRDSPQPRAWQRLFHLSCPSSSRPAAAAAAVRAGPAVTQAGVGEAPRRGGGRERAPGLRGPRVWEG